MTFLGWLLRALVIGAYLHTEYRLQLRGSFLGIPRHGKRERLDDYALRIRLTLYSPRHVTLEDIVRLAATTAGVYRTQISISQSGSILILFRGMTSAQILTAVSVIEREKPCWLECHYAKAKPDTNLLTAMGEDLKALADIYGVN